ncbi:MAG: arylesterase [Thermoanaerobaculia bacterium]
MSRRALALLALVALLAACRGAESSPPTALAPAATAPARTAGTTAPPEERDGPTVVFLGDSLTAGFGVDEDQAYPARVAATLAERGIAARVVNAGVSGDTSAGGLARIDWLLRQKPDLLVVELGANDALRGQPLAGIESNLRAIVVKATAAGATVLLVGMQIPTNYGPEYTAGFRDLYPRLAKETNVALLPFLLEGVAARPELNQGDGIHPNPEGHQRVAATVLAALEPLLRDAAKKKASVQKP